VQGNTKMASKKAFTTVTVHLFHLGFIRHTVDIAGLLHWFFFFYAGKSVVEVLRELVLL